MNAQQKRWHEAAERYAQGDKSDPFAMARAKTHLKNGIAGMIQNGREAIYDAEPFTEFRDLPNGVTFSNGETSYAVTSFRNITRP